MQKRVFRIIGYVLCGIMLAVCIFLIIVSALLGSGETVKVFGVNIFLVETDGIPTAPKNSAVIVQPIEPHEVTAGKLLLYKREENYTLGYAKDYTVQNAVYSVNVVEQDGEHTILENDLIGRADYSSEALGAIIGFVRKPVGIFCIAVLPCLALILYDIIRSFAARIPPPEVVPQIKNKNENSPIAASKIVVSEDGKGTYLRQKQRKIHSDAEDVLFDYEAARKPRPEKKPPARPIIPLTEREEAPKKNPAAIKPEDDEPFFDVDKAPSRTAEAYAKGNTATEEIKLPKNDASDAFFVQSSAPQIRRNAPQIMRKHSPDEENIPQPKSSSSKRSAQIIANKNVEDLMKDEDDVRDKNRRDDIDDILSVLKK